MRVAEVYKSIQGEGFLTGTESVFVRASGCNLRCWFCDTPYASWRPEGDDLSVEEILQRIELLDASHVVLTGGEPMLFAEMIPLCQNLRQTQKHITVETAGTLFLPLACDLMSISPKLSNSSPSAETSPKWRVRHDRTRCEKEVIRQLVAEYPYQFKFVVDDPKDCQEVDEYLQIFPEIDHARVMLMPQGADRDTIEANAVWLEPYCKQRGLTYCDRKQIAWFGMVRGT